MDATVIHETIPDSVLPYPQGFKNKIKYFAWKVITPCHNFWRDLLLKLNILRHDRRQEYLIGTLAPQKNIEGLVEHLKDNGYANHFIAWKDTDAELISVRKLVDFERQYHLRVFNDGEVRGHYEYTPESHPRWHMKGVEQEPHQEVFLDLLGDWIVPVTSNATVRED